jgi:hypothetical protein
MADVFISYSREDRPRADQIARGLEATGLDVFWDSEIPPGQTWADYIEGKLSQCKVVVVLWSEHSTRSQWVREEARMGRDKGKLIPLMIDATPAPFGFAEVQAADLSSWNGDTSDPSWVRVLNAVRAAADAPPVAAPPAQPPRAAMSPPAQSGWKPQGAQQQQQSETKKKGVSPIVWGIGGAVAAIVVLGIIGSQMSDDPVAPPIDPVYVDPGQQPQPAPVSGGVDHQAHMAAQLGQIAQTLGSQGFQQIGQPTVGSLNTSQTQNIPVQMMAGYQYYLAAVCDADCTDLDLALFDGYGNLAVQDNSVSATPMVPVASISQSGNFTLQVQMFACNVQPCSYAAVLYGRAG